jgi:hypothetical protein
LQKKILNEDENYIFGFLKGEESDESDQIMAENVFETMRQYAPDLPKIIPDTYEPLKIGKLLIERMPSHFKYLMQLVLSKPTRGETMPQVIALIENGFISFPECKNVKQNIAFLDLLLSLNDDQTELKTDEIPCCDALSSITKQLDLEKEETFYFVTENNQIRSENVTIQLISEVSQSGKRKLMKSRKNEIEENNLIVQILEQQRGDEFYILFGTYMILKYFKSKLKDKQWKINYETQTGLKTNVVFKGCLKNNNMEMQN